MVCTVLTGMREMAMLENICPPTWKTPFGSVFFRIARVGFRNREKRMIGLMKRRPYPATKPNCTKVKVTGYLYLIRIDFPVLEERAEEVYHRAQ